MANALANEAQIQYEIDQQLSQNPKLSRADKKSIRKSILKKSIAEAPKNSSLQTILSISNTMVGSSLLVFPVLFQQSGVLSSLIIAFIFCAISCKTCQLLVLHNKKEELDLPITILRILGPNYRKLFNITNITILYFASVAFFILICNMLYPLIQWICNKMDILTANQSDISFSQISNQWCGIGSMALLFPVLLLKNLKIIIQLVQYGVISIIVYIVFIIIKGGINIKQIVNVNLFTFDIITLSGVFSLAFMVHQVIIPIMKNNLQQDKNIRDLTISYVWVWLIYAIVGVFGAIAITGQQVRDGVDGSTVLDYMDQNIFTYIILILQLLQLSSVYPLLVFITRAQFFTFIYDLDQPPQYQFILYTLFMAVITLIIQCLNVDVALVMSLSGAVIGFFQLYLIPIILHLQCLYPSNNKQKVNPLLLNDSETSSYLENPDLSIFEDIDFQCVDHTLLKEKIPKQARFILYGGMLIFGFGMGMMNLIAVFIK